MTDGNGKRTPRKATAVEQRKINRLLDEYCRRDSGTEDAPGDCHYINGLSDAAIANMIAPDLNESAVGRIRREVFGNFHKAPKVRQPDAELKAKVDQLASAIGVLSTALLAQTVAFNRYVTDMGEDRRAVSTAWEAKLWAPALPVDTPAPPEQAAGFES